MCHCLYVWPEVLVALPLITVVLVSLSKSILTPGLPNPLILCSNQLSSMSPLSWSHFTLKIFPPTIDFYFLLPGEISALWKKPFSLDPRILDSVIQPFSFMKSKDMGLRCCF